MKFYISFADFEENESTLNFFNELCYALDDYIQNYAEDLWEEKAIYGEFPTDNIEDIEKDYKEDLDDISEVIRDTIGCGIQILLSVNENIIGIINYEPEGNYEINKRS